MLGSLLAACAAKSQPHHAPSLRLGMPHLSMLLLLLLSLLLACSSKLGSDIDEAEAKEAVRILDESKSGYIQFADFVEWFQGRRPRKEAKEAASAQQSQ